MDYDVAAAALASPPASAPVQSYRPSVAVVNLGIHPATVTGTLRIYDRDAGTLLDTMTLTSTAVPVGATRNALADKLWEPVAGDIGKAFLFIASIIWTPDQNLANNNLGPITVTVTAAPPPPPPPVSAHASQHENGGADEVSLEGLTGKAAERQDPTEHASQHQEGGDDQLSVAGLSGETADPQTPKTHAATHGTGGSDPVIGILPAEHGAALHDATVEATAHKGAASGYAGLGANGLVPIQQLGSNVPGANQYLKADQTWSAPPVTAEALVPYAQTKAYQDFGQIPGMQSAVVATRTYQTPDPAPTGFFALASVTIADGVTPPGNCQCALSIRWTSGMAAKSSPVYLFTKLAYTHTFERVVTLFAFSPDEPPDSATEVELFIDNTHNDQLSWGKAQLLISPLT